MAPHSSNLAWKISIDGGAWLAAVHGVAKSQTQLSDSVQHGIGLMQHTGKDAFIKNNSTVK